MNQNPYKYKGPLDPVKDKLVCVPRSEDLNRVIDGITSGDYWAVLGPRQIGKTTFLRQIKNEFTRAHYIYFDFEVSHSDEENFYQEMMNQFLTEIQPEHPKPAKKDLEKLNPVLRFFNFLQEFKPKDDKKKIILLFDEVDRIPFIRSFLHLWRKVFHERYHRNVLNRYAVIMTGGVDLIALTIGSTSPFNIAKTFHMKDFSNEESEKLIDEPFKELNLQIEKKAKEKLLSQISGHPQMLQHACHILVDKPNGSNEIIRAKDVDNALGELLVTNTSIDTLKQDLMMNDILEKLVKDVLAKKKRKFYVYKEFSISGAGAIAKDNSFCKIRNELYKEYISNIPKSKKPKSKKEPVPPPTQSFSKKALVIVEVFLTVLSIIMSLIALGTNKPSWFIVAGILIIIGLFIFVAYSIIKNN